MAALAMLLFAVNLHANNIQVGNTRLIGQNTSAGVDNPANYTLVQFDLSWENSWRTDDLNGHGVSNWDAAWVFVKYRITAANGGDDLWKHAWLSNDGHSGGTGTGATIDAGLLTPGEAFHATTNPGLGAFIYRSANGTGTFSIGGAQLRWNYGANGIADNANVEIRVFAIEMVYVAEGAFAAGSGGSEYSCFTLTTINTADATVLPAGTGSLGGQAGGYPTGQTAPANVLWPNGFAAFYSMKYEITQQQYVDFLNTLTYTQQNNRIDGSPNATVGTFTNNANRHKIKIQTSGVNPGTPAVYETDHPYVACNYLSWMDGAAYVDWAGLRPMTELEFEKACRGTATPVPNEYAWGTATVAGSAYSLSNAGAANEFIATNYSTTAGNAMNTLTKGTIDGPLRVGIFATGSSTRTEAGASYYGIMELSGNLFERPVTIGNVAGRSYTGLHGNGGLNPSGDADVSFWPGINGNSITGAANTAYGGTTGVTEAAGSGLRGSSWTNSDLWLRASDRILAAGNYPLRNDNKGFRGVRSVP